MKKRMILHLIVAAMIWGGCAPRTVEILAIMGERIRFEPHLENSDVLIYSSPGFNESNIKNLLLDPIQINSQFHYAKSHDIEKNQKEILSSAFREEISRALSSFHFVDCVGPETMRLRVRVRDVHPTHWELDENRFLMLRFDTKLESATLEVIGSDALTGRILVAMVHPLKGVLYWKNEKTTRLENMGDAFRTWSHSLSTLIRPSK